MKLVFLAYGYRPGEAEMAAKMISSARAVMPGLTIVQATDLETPLYDGADCAQRLPRLIRPGFDRETFCEFRHRHDLACGDEETILCDTDIVFKSDVRDLFAKPFDVALTVREPGDKLAHLQKHVGGFILSRRAEFWRQVLAIVYTQPDILRSWYGRQSAIDTVAASGLFRVMTLPERIYNRAPRDPGDVAGAAVLHYRGPRKAWLCPEVFTIR